MTELEPAEKVEIKEGLEEFLAPVGAQHAQETLKRSLSWGVRMIHNLLPEFLCMWPG